MCVYFTLKLYCHYCFLSSIWKWNILMDHDDEILCSIPNVMDLKGQGKPCGQVVLAQAGSYVTKICCALVSTLQIEANDKKTDTCSWEGIQMKKGVTMSPLMPDTVRLILLLSCGQGKVSVLYLPKLHCLKVFSWHALWDWAWNWPLCGQKSNHITNQKQNNALMAFSLFKSEVLYSWMCYMRQRILSTFLILHSFFSITQSLAMQNFSQTFHEFVGFQAFAHIVPSA